LPTRKQASPTRSPARKKPGGNAAAHSNKKKTVTRAAPTPAAGASRPPVRARKPPQAAQAGSGALAWAAVATAPLPAGSAIPAWQTAVEAAESKKALDVRVFDLREITSFCDYFVIASGTNPKQVQAIAEEVDVALRKVGERANSVEGFDNAEWILADYGDFIVHVFSEKARAFYDLERLWRAAREIPIPRTV
jgi:ribosome-associated protein